jgi:hypothetical protein
VTRSEQSVLSELKRARLSEREALDTDELDADPVFGELNDDEARALAAGVLARVAAQPEAAARKARNRSRRSALGMLLGTAAVAAGITLVALRPEPAALPRYTLVAPPTDASTRGDAPAQPAHVYTLTRELTLLLRPERATNTTPTLLTFAEQGGARVRLSPQLEVTDKGVLLLHLDASTKAALSPGRVRFVILVLGPDAPPASELDPTREVDSVQRFVLEATLEP